VPRHRARSQSFLINRYSADMKAKPSPIMLADAFCDDASKFLKLPQGLSSLMIATMTMRRRFLKLLNELYLA